MCEFGAKINSLPISTLWSVSRQDGDKEITYLDKTSCESNWPTP